MFLTAKQRSKGSLNPEYAAQCAGKFRHYNFLSAMKHASSVEKWDKANNQTKKAVVYPCSFCGAAHIGHLNAPKFIFPTRDDEIVAIVKSGKAVARQGKPSMLCPKGLK
jgi:hypothetical protein